MTSLLGAALGTLVGVLTAFGQAQLDGVGNAFVNSVAMWLIAPFAIGVLARTTTTGALAGLLACVAQVAGYYLTDHLRGYGVTPHEVRYWTACAIPGGLVFGALGQRGHLTALAAAFLAEGLFTYGYRLHYTATMATWIAIALVLFAASAAAALRSRPSRRSPRRRPRTAPTA
jgi:hypothetical protein